MINQTTTSMENVIEKTTVAEVVKLSQALYLRTIIAFTRVLVLTQMHPVYITALHLIYVLFKHCPPIYSYVFQAVSYL